MKYNACPYCKVTREQVENASNKKVMAARKEGKKNEIYFSSTLPKDVNRMTLMWLTLFLGWAGAGSFYVKRNFRGCFFITSICLGIIFYVIKATTAVNLGNVFEFFYELAFYLLAFVVILWVWDMIAILTKSYKVPVVLGDKTSENAYAPNRKSKANYADIEAEVLKDLENMKNKNNSDNKTNQNKNNNKTKQNKNNKGKNKK